MGIFDKIMGIGEEALGHLERGLPDDYDDETDPPKKVIDVNVIEGDAVIKPDDLSWAAVGKTWHCFVERKHPLCANIMLDLSLITHHVSRFEKFDQAEPCCMGCIQAIHDIMTNLMRGKK